MSKARENNFRELGLYCIHFFAAFGAQELAVPIIVSQVCHCLEHFPENLQLQQEIFAFLVPVLAISGACLIHT